VHTICVDCFPEIRHANMCQMCRAPLEDNEEEAPVVKEKANSYILGVSCLVLSALILFSLLITVVNFVRPPNSVDPYHRKGMKCPRGVPDPIGPQGPQGPQGPPGINGQCMPDTIVIGPGIKIN